MLQILIGSLIVLLVALLFAMLSIGQECRMAVARNCRRLDGSWSASRLRRERSAFTNYATSLFVPLLLALPISLIAAQYILENVIPADQIVSAVLKFQPDQDQWKEGLKSVRDDHEAWLAQKGKAPAESAVIQRVLWHGWPIAATVAISFLVFSLWTFLGVSRSAVADYARGIRDRREGYARRDVLRMMEIGTEPYETGPPNTVQGLDPAR